MNILSQGLVLGKILIWSRFSQKATMIFQFYFRSIISEKSICIVYSPVKGGR